MITNVERQDVHGSPETMYTLTHKVRDITFEVSVSYGNTVTDIASDLSDVPDILNHGTIRLQSEKFVRETHEHFENTKLL